MNRTAVIIGGGLAGLSAAVRLAEADHEVILIETRRKLGGRATSFIDPRSGEVLDNCQHVLMGCCTNLIDLYDRLGVLDAIEWHRTLYWTRGDGQIDEMKAGILPAPLHFAPSFRRMRVLDKSQKRAIARALWKMIRLGQRGRFVWRDRTFADFLHHCKQPQEVVRDFWNTIIVSACNLPVDRVSASSAIQVVQDGFLANKWSYTMGLATVPLWELYEPAARFIEERGGQVRLGESVKAIAYDGKRATGVITEHEIVSAPIIISAVPFDRLDRLVSRTMRSVDARLQHLDQLQASPILGVHLFFDRQVMPPELPHLILIGEKFRGVQWLFNKGLSVPRRSASRMTTRSVVVPSREPTAESREPTAHHLHAVISAADAWMALDERTIIERVLEDVSRALPGAKGLDPIGARAVKEKRATFAATPNAQHHRPSITSGTISPSGGFGGGVPNLFIAGDWVDTGWPATMEGAVRSGYAAANAIMDRQAEPIAAEAGMTRAGTVEDVPPGPLAALLGLRH